MKLVGNRAGHYAAAGVKKLAFIGLLVLGAALALFFVDTTPRAPLGVELALTNATIGPGTRLTCDVTNPTGQPYVLTAKVQSLSNGVWKFHSRQFSKWNPDFHLGPHSQRQLSIETEQPSLVLRLAIHYHKEPTARQRQIDAWLGRIKLGPLYDDPVGEHITTAPTNFPSR